MDEDLVPVLRRRDKVRLLKRLVIISFLFGCLLLSSRYKLERTSQHTVAFHALPQFTAQSAKQREREDDWLRSIQQQSHTQAAPISVTAVLLHHRRTRTLSLQLQHLAGTRFVKEIIIWNNNPAVHLIKADLSKVVALYPNPPNLKIINAPSYVGDQGIWTACSLATHAICYYNHETILNPHLELLYAKLIDEEYTPFRIVAALTRSQIWLYRHFQFENLPEADFHAGIAPLHSAFFPRSWANRFLKQQTTTLTLVSRQALVDSALYFTAWTNTYPDLLTSKLELLDIEGDAVLEHDAISMSHQQVIIEALRSLFDTLKTQDPSLIPDIFPIAASPPAHDARATCANGKCLFTSSQGSFCAPSGISQVMHQLLPAVAPTKNWFEAGGKSRPPMRITNAQAVNFDPHLLTDLNSLVGEIDKFQMGALPLYPSWDDWQNLHSWQLAVDGDIKTCWRSRLATRKGDHFGLRLVHSQQISSVSITGDSSLKDVLLKDVNASWQLLVAYASEPTRWVRSESKLEGEWQEVDAGRNLISLKLGLFSSRPLSGLRFVSTITTTRFTTVCELDVQPFR